MTRSKKESEILVRNFVFGVEDSLVSTVGLLSGIAAGGIQKREIFLTGVVLILVEAFSMGVGSFLSEETAEELVSKKAKQMPVIMGAIIMFISYFIAGMIPIIPYTLFDLQKAFVFSNLFSLVSLFLLGVISATFYKKSVFRIGLKMLVMGGFAVLVGILAGKLLAVKPM